MTDKIKGCILRILEDNKTTIPEKVKHIENIIDYNIAEVLEKECELGDILNGFNLEIRQKEPEKCQ